MKVLSVVGARPNYVKLAAVHDDFSRFFDHVVVDTGQHYDYEMNRVFFKQLEIPEPNYFLGVSVRVDAVCRTVRAGTRFYFVSSI